ncbi:MAG: IS4 family transposase [Proteobacteria bacterium]|nr:IS4 family transposase [Pseudomonadota bacterium]
MQLIKLLHKILQKELSSIHKARLNNLLSACSTAVGTNKLSLTGLGRELKNKNQTNSNIQKMDRLLGNVHLQNERNHFYQFMIGYLIKEKSTPWIHIDWTCINSTTNLYVLRASLSMSGRSIVIYEECHTKKGENNHPTHKVFLNQLKLLLPAGVKPVIVTDAGFRAPWFEHILKLGWNFVGRLRNKNLIKLDTEARWQLSASLFSLASNTALYVGHGILTKEKQVSAHFITYKGKKKGRHQFNKYGKPSLDGMSKLRSKSQKEPWILVTSLPQNLQTAQRAVQIYKQRMQIEENIRDTKCDRYGQGLKKSLSRSPNRLNILLLVAALSTFAAWLAGIFTIKTGKAASFQAHSSKFTSVLSKVYLGREALKKGFSITKRDFYMLLKMLFEINYEAQLESSL